MKICSDFCMVALRKQRELWLQHMTKLRLWDGSSGLVRRSWRKGKNKLFEALRIPRALGFPHASRLDGAGGLCWLLRHCFQDIPPVSIGARPFSPCPAQGRLTQMWCWADGGQSDSPPAGIRGWRQEEAAAAASGCCCCCVGAEWKACRAAPS